MVGYGAYITAYVVAVAAVLGLVVGSFVNCWAWRYVRGESVAKGRSHCTSCGHELGVRDLVPVASWLASRGRCRHCGAKVSARYPVTEVIAAVAFAAIAYAYGPTFETVELLAFAAVLLFLSLTDIDDFIIPNGAIIAALAVRMAYLGVAWAIGDIDVARIGYYVASAFGIGAGMLAVVLVADRVFGRESMGGGDLKLFFVAGLYFGWQQGVFLIMAACVIGLVVAFARAGSNGAASPGPNAGAPNPASPPAASARAASKPFPFGPSIAVACLITMFVGQAVVSWYLGFL